MRKEKGEDDLIGKGDLDNLIKKNLGKYVSEFLTSLDQEMNKFFNFFSKLEKETYCEIKRHLYLDVNYKYN